MFGINFLTAPVDDINFAPAKRKESAPRVSLIVPLWLVQKEARIS